MYRLGFKETFDSVVHSVIWECDAWSLLFAGASDDAADAVMRHR